MKCDICGEELVLHKDISFHKIDGLLDSQCPAVSILEKLIIPTTSQRKDASVSPNLGVGPKHKSEGSGIIYVSKESQGGLPTGNCYQCGRFLSRIEKQSNMQYDYLCALSREIGRKLGYG